MTTLQSLIDGFKAATSPLSPELTGAFASSLHFLGAGSATSPNVIYAFGDSTTDAGNISDATFHTLPNASIYSGGRFTNGNVWVQDLAQDLKLPAVTASLSGGTDYAYGGAYTGTLANHTQTPADLPAQLGQFVAAHPSPAPGALYAVWTGSNDVLSAANNATLTTTQQQAIVTQAVNNELGFLNGLVQHGARNLLVLNVTDLGKTPQESSEAATASALSAQYDQQLAKGIQQLVATGAVKVELVDTYALLDNLVANPAAYGLSNVTGRVWSGNLTDPHSGVLNAVGGAQNQYAFFDGLHPTTAVHAQLASNIAQTV
jgi:phospholipase/lecithinase/hemolysin